VTEYTPTTEEIRDYVGEGGEPRPWIAPDEDAERETARLAAFDRWLAAHDREVRAKAWTEGLHKAYNHVDRLEQADAAGQGVMVPDPVNPYREEAEHV